MRKQIHLSESQGKTIDEVFFSRNHTQIIILFLGDDAYSDRDGEYYSVIDFNNDIVADPTVFEEDLSLWGIE